LHTLTARWVVEKMLKTYFVKVTGECSGIGVDVKAANKELNLLENPPWQDITSNEKLS